MTIFHSRKYFDLHGGSAYLQHGDCILPLWTVGGTTHSPLRGTFAGPSGGSMKDLERVVQDALAISGQHHYKLAPQGHDAAHFAQTYNVLVRAGFKVSRHELNYERPVNNSGAFEQGLSRGEFKHLNACLRAGWEVTASNFDGQIYDVIAENRKRKGRELSMSYEAVRDMAEAFPEELVCFRVNRLRDLATAICLRLSPDILYVYAWGDIGDAEHSPIVLLAHGIYEWCCMNGVKLLDIGTATEDGVPNVGLTDFKMRLGFRPSLKITMSRY